MLDIDKTDISPEYNIAHFQYYRETSQNKFQFNQDFINFSF